MVRHRTLLILILVWALAMIVPDLVRLVRPLGSFGFSVNSDGLIYDVTAPFADATSSPAFKAGIREGQRLDLARMNCRSYDEVKCASALAVLGGLQYVLPGRVAVFDLAATPDAPAHAVTVVAAVRPSNWLVRLVLFLDSVAGILVVLAAAWLAVRRPGRMSWGFFLFAVWFNPGQSFVFYAFLQQWPMVLLIQNVLASMAQGAGYAGLLLFALRVPNDTIEARWIWLERALPLLAIAFALALLYSYGDAFGFSTETVVRATLLAGFAVDLGALAILFSRRKNQSPEDYQRVRWVIWGCAIGLPAFIIAQLAQGTSLFDRFWGKTPPYDILGLLFLANGVFCLFVVWALSRTRVVSVSIPLRRVTLLGFSFSIPALLLHNQVEHIHEALDLPDWAWLCIAVIALYLISRLHEFAVHIAEHYFNRPLDHAEDDLRRAVLAASAPEQIDRLLSADTAHALRLASAATFRSDDTHFQRHESGVGWDDTNVALLPASDAMLAPSRNGLPFNLDDTSIDPRLPSGLRRPILAIPVVNRVHCFAVALYGPHASGNDLSANEREMLARLGATAADCYAQLENQALRERIAELEMAVPMRA